MSLRVLFFAVVVAVSSLSAIVVVVAAYTTAKSRRTSRSSAISKAKKVIAGQRQQQKRQQRSYDDGKVVKQSLPSQSSFSQQKSSSFVVVKNKTKKNVYNNNKNKDTAYKSEAATDETTMTTRTVVIMYHKPSNVITTHAKDDVFGRRNVYDDIRSMNGYVDSIRTQKSESQSQQKYEQHDVVGDMTFEHVTGVSDNDQVKWHAIGRLDADTTGLLLITNDGGLVHHVTNKHSRTHHITPSTQHHRTVVNGISKTYEALIMGYHIDDHYDDDNIFNQLRTDGVDIGIKYGGRTQPVHDVQVLGHPTSKTTLVSLTINEGMNRQVRRMFHALGSGVMKLKRTRIGDTMTLGDLADGEWRILSDDEVQNDLLWTPRRLVQRPTTMANNGNNKNSRRRS